MGLFKSGLIIEDSVSDTAKALLAANGIEAKYIKFKRSILELDVVGVLLNQLGVPDIAEGYGEIVVLNKNKERAKKILSGKGIPFI